VFGFSSFAETPLATAGGVTSITAFVVVGVSAEATNSTTNNTLSAAVSISASSTESIYVSASAFDTSVSETAAAIGFLAANNSYVGLIEEGAVSTANDLEVQADYFESLSESGSAEDSSLATNTIVRNIAIGVSAVDVSDVLPSVFSTSFSSDVLASEVNNAAGSTFHSNAIATVSGAASLTNEGNTFITHMNEAVDTADSESVRKLWEVINDSQPAGWQTIPTTQ